MQYQTLVAILLAASSDVVFASISSKVVKGNDKRDVSSLVTIRGQDSPKRRDLKALFTRDPEFELDMQEIGRQAQSSKDIDGMVDDIKRGTTPAVLVQAATRRGLIKNVQGFQGKNSGNPDARPRPSAELEAASIDMEPDVISGPKEEAHPTSKVAQHVSVPESYIPPRIQQAIQSSTYFLAPGQYSSNPTAKPLRERDIEGGILHVRTDGAVSNDEFVTLLNAMKRNPAANEDILAILQGTPAVKSMVSALIKKYAENSDGKVNLSNMESLVEAMQTNKKAQTAVLAAFNKNPQIAKVTVGLFDKWSAPEDVVKRNPKEEIAYLAARDLDTEMQHLGVAKRDLENDPDILTFEARDPEARIYSEEGHF